MAEESQKASSLAWESDVHTAACCALWHYHHLGITDGLSLPKNRLEDIERVSHRSAQFGASGSHSVPKLNSQSVAAKTAVTKKNLLPPNPSGLFQDVSLSSVIETAHQPIMPKTPAEKDTALFHLSEKMAAFSDLSICHTSQNMVFADGNPHAGIMLVGEAPGAEEDLQGKPFVGASGKLLNSMLASIGLDRTRSYIANVVPWRPPFNRQPSSEEIRVCLPFLHEHIHIVQPRVIICVGGVAAKALLQLTQTLTETQGHLLAYQSPLQSESIPAWTLYHPAYLMRSPGQKKVAWQQLLCIQAFLDSIGLVYRAKSGEVSSQK